MPEIEAVEHDVERDGDADDRRPHHRQRQREFAHHVDALPVRASTVACWAAESGRFATPCGALTSAGTGPFCSSFRM